MRVRLMNLQRPNTLSLALLVLYYVWSPNKPHPLHHLRIEGLGPLDNLLNDAVLSHAEALAASLALRI